MAPKRRDVREMAGRPVAYSFTLARACVPSFQFRVTRGNGQCDSIELLGIGTFQDVPLAEADPDVKAALIPRLRFAPVLAIRMHCRCKLSMDVTKLGIRAGQVTRALNICRVGC